MQSAWHEKYNVQCAFSTMLCVASNVQRRKACRHRAVAVCRLQIFSVQCVAYTLVQCVHYRLHWYHWGAHFKN